MRATLPASALIVATAFCIINTDAFSPSLIFLGIFRKNLLIEHDIYFSYDYDQCTLFLHAPHTAAFAATVYVSSHSSNASSVIAASFASSSSGATNAPPLMSVSISLRAARGRNCGTMCPDP